MSEHGAAYFSCDYVGGKPEHRTTCREAVTVRPDQGALWIDSGAVIPDGWSAAMGGHLCSDHVGLPNGGHMATLIFRSSS
jgi:hypothetical protein